MRFAIFTHVQHISEEGNFLAYSPYVREINLWLRHVEEVEIVAPLNIKAQNATTEVYVHDRIKSTDVPSFDLLSLKSSFRALLLFPLICTRILAAMHRADHLHLRCPGNMGLLACICQILFPSKPKTAKYAGNWDPAARQPWTYKLQKWILSNSYLTRNMQVLVYGDWEGQSKNVVPFFTASFSEKDVPSIEERDFSGPFIFLFVGNLVPGKRPLEAIKLMEKINTAVVQGLHQEHRNGEIVVNLDSEFHVKLEIFGDGPEREKMQRYCREHGLEKQVHFYGSRALEELKAAYQKAHFVVLPSQSEGWPKAIAEGMFYGCIPIVTPVSCVPWMMGNGSRGVLLKDLSQKLTADGQRLKNSCEWPEDVGKICRLIQDKQEMQRMSNEAKKWSQQYTVERFEAAIKEVLNAGCQKESVEIGELSPAPFREGAKRGKGKTR